MLKIDMKYRKGTLIVEIKGYLNKFSSHKLESYLVPVILKHEIKKVIYDTEKLKGIDKYGLKVLKVLKGGLQAVKGNSGYIYYSKNSKILNIEG